MTQHKDPLAPDNKNLLLAIMLSLIVLFGFYQFFDKPAAKKMQEEHERALQIQTTQNPAPIEQIAAKIMPRDESLSASPRVKISSPSLHGSINLQGGRLDDVTLAKYFETIEKKNEVLLLSPEGTEAPYYVDYGFLADDKSIALPDAKTIWKADKTELTPEQPVTLRWDNGKGLVFERVISIDANYMIDVTQRVTNDSGNAVSVFPYARIARPHIAPYPGHFRGEHAMRILHEGAIGFLQNRLSEWNYAKLSDNSEAQQIVGTNSTGGWLGMTDKYWLVALVPSQTEAYDARFVRTGAIERTGSWPSRKTVNDTRDFQVDYRGSALTVAPHTTAETKQSIFTGAKEVSQLDAYEISHNVPRFDLAVDFGWFYFLTKPLFYVLDWLGKHVGNFGVAILLLTLMVRAAVFPIASRSAMSMARMKKISPMMKELQARHKDDKAKLQLEMMALYKREKFNPAGGCLPILIQIPIFFSLYKVLFVTIEMRHAPFYGWIHDLSAPDPTSLFNLFGLLPFHPPIMLGLLPLLMGISMFIQMKMNPPPQDPTQAAMMNYMPLVFMFMMASFPAGLVLYWTLSNICGIAQQFYIKHKMKEKHVAPDPDMLQI